MELALLRSRGPGLVPELPCPHELRQGGVLPRHVAASCPPWRVQAQGSALLRHPRGRGARRGADGDVDPAGGRPARLGPVAGPTFALRATAQPRGSCGDTLREKPWHRRASQPYPSSGSRIDAGTHLRGHGRATGTVLSWPWTMMSDLVISSLPTVRLSQLAQQPCHIPRPYPVSPLETGEAT
jgi:hypothetical protein